MEKGKSTLAQGLPDACDVPDPADPKSNIDMQDEVRHGLGVVMLMKFNRIRIFDLLILVASRHSCGE